MSEGEKDSDDVASTDEKKDENSSKGKSPVDRPLKDISEPHENDVLYGRGGGTNHHKGNKRYRKMVEDRKVDYVNSKRLDKPMVALEIVRTWRAQDPPGRFLKLDEKTNLWNDVGDRKAREKISQALREKAPQIRKQQEDERLRKEGKLPEELEEKQTTFAPGTEDKTKSADKPLLARDHSLGREYLKDNEEVHLDNFSWQDPFQRESSLQSTERNTSQGPMGPPPPYNPHVRVGSHSSMGSFGPPPPGVYPYHYEGHGGVPPSPAHQHFAQPRAESWSSIGAPPPPMPGVASSHQGSWTTPDNSLGQFPLPHASVGQPAQYSTFDARAHSGQWGPYPQPPSGDGHIPYHYSNGPPPPHHPYPHHPPPQVGHAPPPPPGQYRLPSGHMPPTPGHYHPPSAPPDGSATSNGYMASDRREQVSSTPGSATATTSSPKPSSPPYSVDAAVASTWSGQGDDTIVQTMSGEEYDQLQREKNGPKVPVTTSKSGSSSMPKPHIVKRMTSNQNETAETKPDLQGPSVKRCALNRDSSRASNRLKELSFPKEFRNGKFDIKKEMTELGQDMEQSKLSASRVPMERLSTVDMLPPMDELDEPASESPQAPKPSRITNEARTSTIDDIAMDLMVRPVALDKSGRSSTIDALALDFVDEIEDPVIRSPPGRDELERLETMESTFSDLRANPPRPPMLQAEDRLTTTDFVNMINEPIPEESTVSDQRANPPRPPMLQAGDRLTTTDFVNMINEPIPEDLDGGA